MNFNKSIIARHILFSFIGTLLFVPFLVAQTTSIPDVNFENYLETHTADGALVSVGDASSMGDGVNGNGTVLTSSIDNVITLDVSNQNISNITGIAAFTSLETLICSNNDLTNVDVSNNTNLTSLLCGSNALVGLSLANNTGLETLNCSDNQIQVLDLSNLSALKSLTCSANQLMQLNISNNTNISFLNVSNNRLTGLDVSVHYKLESLFCASNQIADLNLLNNASLKNLNASNNLLSILDLSLINIESCPDPQTDPATVCQGSGSINVSKNQLVTLNISNGFNDLISTFNSEDNPDLYCIQVDASYSPPLAWIKDDWTYYSETTCADIFTYVPDDNFEQALIDLGYDNVLDNFVLTANINGLASLDITNKSISSLSGIEDFVDLETLDCSMNQIEYIDFSNNTGLLQINVSNNTLSSLNLSSNLVLQIVDCSNNSISNLDLRNNVALTNLNCANNSLTNLDIANNVLLVSLDCSFNQIEVLDISVNASLVSFICNDNSLFSLNVQNGTNNTITAFNAMNNANLFCIQVDNIANANAAAGWLKDVSASYNLICGTYVPDDNFEQALIDLNIDSDGTLNNFVPTADINALTILDVSGLGITDLTGIEDFLALQTLNCSNNTLSVLDLSDNVALQILNCSNNQIEYLNFASNTSLSELLCNNNALFTLNIKNGANVNLSVFNATNNPSLFCINVDDAIIGNIPGSWQKDAIATYNVDCENNRFTTIPDDNFEQALIDLGLDSGPLDNQVLTSNIEHILNLNVNNKQIQSLEGIQDFVSLTSLDCSNNYLSDLDISGMVNLEELYCSSNYFLTNNISNTAGLLNTTGTVSLKKLFCSSNKLADLDTSLNINLEELDCADNNLSVLNISGNSLLKLLDCSNNKLSVLNITNNVFLEEVNCNNNDISNLIAATSTNTTLTKLSCANNDMTNLQVNNYLSLVEINAGSNSLTQLNTNSNVALEILNITNNEISNLNLVSNTNLMQLFVAQNQLSQLDLTTNAQLLNLNCNFNEISQLSLDGATLLRYLSCTNNQLSTLDVSNNSDLIEINVSNNILSVIVLANDLNQLKILNCSNNLLEANLDLSTMGTGICPLDLNSQDFCSNEIMINVANNQLQSINIQNGINANISMFNGSSNPVLKCIQVDDVNNIGAEWQKDTTAQYSINCRIGETYVPDDNFEQTLINLGYDAGPLDDYVATSVIAVVVLLDVNSNAIMDLTGIEDFAALQNLNCSNNSLVEININQNENLIELDCSNNGLTNLDVSNNVLLTNINCSNNSLSSLDLTSNVDLVNLNISNNSFLQFIPGDILFLQVFNCDSNQLVDLDFRSNESLTSLSCANNLLETLNIKNGQNASLSNLNALNNTDLTCIETDSGTVPSGVTWLKDVTTQFAINCHFGETYVPDDAFETALINLGYDSGDLDDYVQTSNISVISYLDVSAQNISDLTGIEDFVKLKTLIFEGNQIANVNLNNNILLENLNASNNMLFNLDVSLFVNLKQLNTSGNMLAQINLDSNIDILDLNVSNNVLTSINLGLLIGLKKLVCSNNQLVELDVTSNPNLIELTCHSNAFIQDKLNLQNGANEKLVKFTATNNPDLRCILVDDPFEVISNTSGTYDNWFKDATANYQIICDDADNDGVANIDDQCPNTPFGYTVDLFGCPILELPNNNFAILITGETCLNNNDGKINISTLEYYNYTATLTKANFSKTYHFTNEIDILNLLAGTYQLCITMEEWPDFEQCYTAVISQPDPLEVISSKSTDGGKVSLDMYGSTSFNIKFNEFEFTTNDASLTLNLKHGENTLKISTDIDCQGIYEESLFFSDYAQVYPNPFQNKVDVYLGSAKEEVKVNVFSYLGQLVYSHKTLDENTRNIQIDTSQWAEGFYSVVVEAGSSFRTFKIVKK
ncbi:T9SS type A sorting domain-containing protein [Flavobacteriaceae bacterium SZ-1-7]|uniref:T9SS type A sorting domain-containing protein n=1 Tax=Tamlana sedimenti TaxID=3134126 RepID=UPI003129C3E4